MEEREASQESPTPEVPEEKAPALLEVRIAKAVVLGSFLVVVGSATLAIFVSIYRGASAEPKVWRAPLTAKAPSADNVPLESAQVRACVQNLQALDQEQHQQTSALWFRLRHGHRGYLTLWQEWSRDWRRRMKRLMKQCPLRPQKGPDQSPAKLSYCVAQHKKLSTALQKKADALWLKSRKGQGQQLRKWREWSRNWRRRMRILVERCPLYHRGDIAKAFGRASQKMLQLQSRNEKTLLPFFTRSNDLFRDIRQAMHSLKEELR